MQYLCAMLSLQTPAAPGFLPVEAALCSMAVARGDDIAGGTITIAMDGGAYTWNGVAVARSRKAMMLLSDLGFEMGQFPGVQSFHLACVRN
jgi:putative Mg2+ transporter-C (MgtC) family protein